MSDDKSKRSKAADGTAIAPHHNNCNAVVVILILNSTVTGSTRCGARITLSFELFTHIKIITAGIFDIEVIKSMDTKDENRRCFPEGSATSVANSSSN